MHFVHMWYVVHHLVSSSYLVIKSGPTYLLFNLTFYKAQLTDTFRERERGRPSQHQRTRLTVASPHVGIVWAKRWEINCYTSMWWYSVFVIENGKAEEDLGLQIQYTNRKQSSVWQHMFVHWGSFLFYCSDFLAWITNQNGLCHWFTLLQIQQVEVPEKLPSWVRQASI